MWSNAYDISSDDKLCQVRLLANKTASRFFNRSQDEDITEQVRAQQVQFGCYFDMVCHQVQLDT